MVFAGQPAGKLLPEGAVADAAPAGRSLGQRIWPEASHSAVGASDQFSEGPGLAAQQSSAEEEQTAGELVPWVWALYSRHRCVPSGWALHS